ncbi:MAG: CarD family transcriptional regulator [Lachnospiraceae bacterium]|nr:CarD family transcriptional regulator [Lachnospiraceae bacterium]
MFAINEFVIHTTGGICQVKNIAPLDMPGADKSRKYYFLAPIKTNGSKVFVPVDNDGTIRKVLTGDEAWELIDEIPEIEEMRVDNEKQRENLYKEAIRSCDCRELVSVIKNLYSRREKRLSEGKKTTATDDKYFKIAEDNLFSELAFAIGRNKDEILDIISGRMEEGSI